MTLVFDGVILLFLFISLIIGWKKGFIKCIWWLVSLAIMCVGLYFSTPPIAKQICDKTTIDESFEKKFSSWYSKIPAIDTEITYGNIDAAITTMKDAKTPSIVVKIVEKAAKTEILEGQTMTAKALIADKTAYVSFLLIVGLVLAIIFGIIINIIKKLLFKLFSVPIIKPLNKALGVIYSVALTIIIFLFIGGLGFTMSERSYMNAVNTNASKTYVFKYIYGENPLQSFIDKKLNINNKLDAFLDKIDKNNGGNEQEKPNTPTPPNTDNANLNNFAPIVNNTIVNKTI